MSSIPTSSASSSNAASSSLLSRPHHHHAPEETVHMNILGRDGNDAVIVTAENRVGMRGIGGRSTTTTNDDAQATAASAEDLSSSSMGANPATTSTTASLPPLSSSIPSSRSRSRGEYQPPTSPTNEIESSTSSLSQQQQIPLTPTTSNVTPKKKSVKVNLENNKKSYSNTNINGNENANANGNHNDSTGHWWGKMLWASKNPENTTDLNYRSLEAPFESDDTTNGRPPRQSPQKKQQRQYRQQQQQQDPLATITAELAMPASNTSNTTTVEDQLRQDCTFFYRDLDDDEDVTNAEARGGGPGRILRRGDKRRMRPIRALSSPVFTSRDGAMFHAKYQKLNQVLDSHRSSSITTNGRGSGIATTGDNDDDNDGLDYDLRLSAAEEAQPPLEETISFYSNTSRNVVDVQHSSLFYEQNGRLLMRLPRDQIRLVMDTEIQAGIVSVEQWRPNDVEDQWKANSSGGQGGTGTGTSGSSGTSSNLKTVEPSSSPASTSFWETTPPLRYVLTVPDDLYRRVVSELSHELIGYGRCCHENERADIRVAIAMLAVILLLLLISTLEWPTE